MGDFAYYVFCIMFDEIASFRNIGSNTCGIVFLLFQAIIKTRTCFWP